MKLYVFPIAPNAMRVEVVIAEKGLSIETVEVPFGGGADYRAVNPIGQVPALALDDGTIITESLTICQYLDALSGPPLLFGETLAERTTIAMWERRAEMLLFNRAVEYGHHVNPIFAPHMIQYPDWAKTLVPRMAEMLALTTTRLADVPYLAGDTFSAADITAYLGYFWLVSYQVVPVPTDAGLVAWTQRVAARPSMAVVHRLAAQFGAKAPGAA